MIPKGRPFEKGKSGNPGGRPRVPPDVKALARGLTEEAILNAAEIMRDTEQPGAARMSAINTILDRGWGKPAQHITTESLETYSDDEIRDQLRAAIDELRRYGIDAEGPTSH